LDNFTTKHIYFIVFLEKVSLMDLILYLISDICEKKDLTARSSYGFRCMGYMKNARYPGITKIRQIMYQAAKFKKMHPE